MGEKKESSSIDVALHTGTVGTVVIQGDSF